MKCMHLERGRRRLWRCIDKGPKFDTPADHNHVHKVFVCFSTKVQDGFDAGAIKMNK